MFTSSTYWHNLISRLNNPLTICIPFKSLLFLIIHKRDAAWTINNNADIASPCLLPLYNGKYSQIVPFVMHSMLIWTQLRSNLRIDHQNWISNAILSNTFIITHFQKCFRYLCNRCPLIYSDFLLSTFDPRFPDIFHSSAISKPNSWDRYKFLIEM